MVNQLIRSGIYAFIPVIYLIHCMQEIMCVKYLPAWECQSFYFIADWLNGITSWYRNVKYRTVKTQDLARVSVWDIKIHPARACFRILLGHEWRDKEIVCFLFTKRLDSKGWSLVLIAWLLSLNWHSSSVIMRWMFRESVPCNIESYYFLFLL